MDKHDQQQYDELHQNWFDRGEKIQELNHAIARLQARCRTLERRRNQTFGALDDQVVALADALEWALQEGANYSYDFSNLYNRGCGCCSYEIGLTEIPDSIIAMMKEHRTKHEDEK